MRYFFFLLLCLFVGNLSAQTVTSGMQFTHKPFMELLAQAKAEDKIIFIDAYTTWCGPCKMMAAKVFPQEAVGEVYNARFINAKFDMEKGEGIELAKRYRVQAFPTYLFIDGDGEIVHKGLGYIPAAEFLALADVASGDDNIGALNRKYAAGDRDPAFLETYIATLNAVYEEAKASEVLSAYLDSVEDWDSPAIMEMIMANPGELGGKKMDYLIANADAILAQPEGENFLLTIQRSIINGYMQEHQLRQLPEAAALEPLYAAAAPALKERLLANYAVLKAQSGRDIQQIIPAMIDYLETYPVNNWNVLNATAWDIYENSEDKKQLAAGIRLAEKSVALDENYANLDTLAWLYQKTGQRKLAVKTAKKAIAIAEAEGMDYSETEKILTEKE